MTTPFTPLAFGLTGGIACGKSTVAGYFRELGAHIIDADVLGHELIQPGQPAYHEITKHFGGKVLDATRAIDRRKLGARVFADERERQALNAILHPRIIARMGELVREQQARDAQVVVIVDAPLIYEAGIETEFRKIIAVWCGPEQQLERLMAKTGLSQQEAERRIAAQMPAEEKRRRADYAIDSSGSREGTREQAQTIFRELERIVRLSS